ncbi:MAG: hypothetical protein HUU15_17980 [Candidatus Brocadiae bacterium]|nr:hypothetical protein [Candidatus Brocadiia bacterium]
MDVYIHRIGDHRNVYLLEDDGHKVTVANEWGWVMRWSLGSSGGTTSCYMGDDPLDVGVREGWRPMYGLFAVDLDRRHGILIQKLSKEWRVWWYEPDEVRVEGRSWLCGGGAVHFTLDTDVGGTVVDEDQVEAYGVWEGRLEKYRK